MGLNARKSYARLTSEHRRAQQPLASSLPRMLAGLGRAGLAAACRAAAALAGGGAGVRCWQPYRVIRFDQKNGIDSELDATT